MVKEIASKVSDEAGDGTTTATVLAQAIYREGMKMGRGRVTRRWTSSAASTKAVKAIGRPAEAAGQAFEGLQEIAQVGTISANNDETIGKIIAEPWRRSGRKASFTSRKRSRWRRRSRPSRACSSTAATCRLSFVTDPERMEAVIEEPYVLIYEKKVSSMKDLLPLLENIAKQGKPLVIIAEDVEGEALATLVVNKAARHAAGVRDPRAGIR